MSKARKPETDRVCAVCAANAGREGPLPHAWDQHLVQIDPYGDGREIRDVIRFSCSAKCRAARGFAERKGATCSS